MKVLLTIYVLSSGQLTSVNTMEVSSMVVCELAASSVKKELTHHVGKWEIETRCEPIED